MNIVFLGPQGSGKGTQAKLLEQKHGFFYFEMGGVLRRISAQKTALGEKIAVMINQGQMVPTPVVFEIVNQFLTAENLQKGIIFDGFPRLAEQAELLENQLAGQDSRIDKVIWLQLEDSEVIRRLSARRICSQCGQIYNLLTLPSRQEGVCDQCGGKLIVRQDDTPEAIKKRLAVYQQQTVPLIERYQKKGLVITVDGSRSVEAIHQDILKRLKL